jgi:hypothetical protein
MGMSRQFILAHVSQSSPTHPPVTIRDPSRPRTRAETPGGLVVWKLGREPAVWANSLSSAALTYSGATFLFFRVADSLWTCIRRQRGTRGAGAAWNVRSSGVDDSTPGLSRQTRLHNRLLDFHLYISSASRERRSQRSLHRSKRPVNPIVSSTLSISRGD